MPGHPDDTSLTQARLVLGVTASATTAEIKRRYRALAREHHPDRGGDPDRFHELRLAVDVLLDGPTARRREPAAPRGAAAWARAEARERGSTPADLTSVDWDRETAVTAPRALDRHLLAVLLARGGATAEAGAPVAPLAAVSRKPGGRRRPWAAALSEEFLSTLAVAGARGAVEVVFEFRPRGARRRALDAVWPIGWTRDRPTTDLVTARRRLEASPQPRATAVRTTDLVTEALQALQWPLTSWWVTPEGVSDGG